MKSQRGGPVRGLLSYEVRVLCIVWLSVWVPYGPFLLPVGFNDWFSMIDFSGPLVWLKVKLLRAIYGWKNKKEWPRKGNCFFACTEYSGNNVAELLVRWWSRLAAGVFLATWPRSHRLGSWWLHAFLFLLVDAICIVHFSFPLLTFDLFLSLKWALILCYFSHPSQSPPNGFPAAGLTAARGMGDGEGLLCHLEANLLLVVLTGPVRMCFFHTNAAQFLVRASDVSGVWKGGWLLAGLRSQLPCRMVFEVPKTNLQIKVLETNFS